MILIFIVVIIVGFAGYALGAYTTNTDGDSDLLKQYKGGFTQCNNHCSSKNLTSYIREISNNHYRCNCFNITGDNDEFIQQ